MVNKILKELDQMIKLQQVAVERAEQESDEAVVYLEHRELTAYMKVKDMINEKCASEAATSKGTQMDINSLSQANYNTDGKKSEIRRLIMEFIDMCFEYSDKLSEISNTARYPLIHLELNFFKTGFGMDVSTHIASVFEPIFVFKEYIDSDEEAYDPDEGITKIDSIAISKKLKKKLSEVLNEIGTVEK